MATDTQDQASTRRPVRHINECVIEGNLTDTPSIRKAGTTDVCEFTIASNDMRQGKPVDPSYIKITVFGAQAVSNYRWLRKGRQVTVVGQLRVHSYDDVNSPDAKALGKAIRRTRAEIVARQVGWGYDPNSRPGDTPVANAFPEGFTPSTPAQPQPQVAAEQVVVEPTTGEVVEQPAAEGEPEAAMQVQDGPDPSATPDF